jgi:hypothetical protein
MLFSVDIVGVHYHENLCTKNKCMFRILALRLFLTLSFIWIYTCIKDESEFYLLIKNQKPTYLGRKSFFHGGECPIPSGPCSKSAALHPLCFPSPPTLTAPHAHHSHTKHLFLHTKTTLTSPILVSRKVGFCQRKFTHVDMAFFDATFFNKSFETNNCGQYKFL